jgi:hypothetical protein
MLEWQSIKSRLQKVKLHSCIAYRIASDGLVGQHGYLLLYASQGIGFNRRGMFFLGSSLKLWHHHCCI